MKNDYNQVTGIRYRKIQNIQLLVYFQNMILVLLGLNMFHEKIHDPNQVTGISYSIKYKIL